LTGEDDYTDDAATVPRLRELHRRIEPAAGFAREQLAAHAGRDVDGAASETTYTYR
jgi:hypothetical protein